LNRHDLQNFILQRWAKKEINDFKFFDGQGEKIDFFKTLDLAIFY